VQPASASAARQARGVAWRFMRQRLRRPAPDGVEKGAAAAGTAARRADPLGA
jgi:hypothetical protein